VEDVAEVLARHERAAVLLPPATARRVLRESAGLTQQDLADALGVRRATIARYELSQREPHGDLRRRYAAALKFLGAYVAGNGGDAS
jgi:transcriptional regulator with XRE-family HTH domain